MLFQTFVTESVYSSRALTAVVVLVWILFKIVLVEDGSLSIHARVHTGVYAQL